MPIRIARDDVGEGAPAVDPELPLAGSHRITGPPAADRAATVRQRYTPPPTTSLTSGVLFAFASPTRSIATSSGRTASIIEVSASQACISADCVSRILA